jgi:mycothiol synthase
MPIRPMTEEDLPRVLALWNSALHYDQMTERRFRHLILEDPNYEPEGVLVALDSYRQTIGLAAAVVRREPAGKDGGGSPDQFHRGYIKALVVPPSEPGYTAGGALLEAIEVYVREAGKRELTMSVYTGPYVFPGVDLRYEGLRSIFARRGYRDIYTIECVGIDLRDPVMDRMLADYRAKLPRELSVRTWRPSYLPALRAFVKEGDVPAWFPTGWEAGYKTAQDTCLVLRKGREILSWARYSPHPPTSGFGPILVLPRDRGHGYGGILLLESMARARDAGCTYMKAGWANTGFYVRHGWHIIRRFAVLQKEL